MDEEEQPLSLLPDRNRLDCFDIKTLMLDAKKGQADFLRVANMEPPEFTDKYLPPEHFQYYSIQLLDDPGEKIDAFINIWKKNLPYLNSVIVKQQLRTVLESFYPGHEWDICKDKAVLLNKKLKLMTQDELTLNLAKFQRLFVKANIGLVSSDIHFEQDKENKNLYRIEVQNIHKIIQSLKPSSTPRLAAP